MRRFLTLLAATLAIYRAACHAAPRFAGVQHIGNHDLTATIKLSDCELCFNSAEDTASHASIHLDEVLVLVLQGGREILSAAVDVQGGLTVSRFALYPVGTRSKVIAGLKRTLPLAAGKSITYTCVIGTARPGQLSRDFLAYVEQERDRRREPGVHPTRSPSAPNVRPVTT